MTLVLAVDQGTSSSRAIVFTADGQIRGQGQVPIDMQFPHDGWVEQDPEVLWSTTVSAIRSALQAAQASAADIAALGITNQRETTLVWERATGDCIYPAIVWQDGRTAEQCAVLERAGSRRRDCGDYRSGG